MTSNHTDSLKAVRVDSIDDAAERFRSMRVHQLMLHHACICASMATLRHILDGACTRENIEATVRGFEQQIKHVEAQLLLRGIDPKLWKND